MTNLTKLLQDADPAREDKDEGLSPAAAQAMRREILAAVRERSFTFPAWQRPLAIAAVVALMVTAGGIAGRRMIERDSTTANSARSGSPEFLIGGSSVGNERRQLQFATPGGTRIIWIFDQNLRLQETMP